MSLVALVVKNLGENSAKSISILMKSFGINLIAIKNAIANGKPVIQRKLFDRTDQGFPNSLVSTLEKLDKLGCEWIAYELLDDQVYSPDTKYYEITLDRLRNIIKTHDESLEQQRRLGEKEGE